MRLEDPTKEYQGEIVTTGFLIDTVSGTIHSLGADTATFSTVAATGSTRGEIRSRMGQSRVTLRVEDELASRVGRDRIVPTGMREIDLGQGRRLHVVEEWAREGSGWVLQSSTTALSINGRSVMQITRTVLSGRPVGPARALSQSPREASMEQSGGDAGCCAAEYRALQRYVDTAGIGYGGWLVACLFTGLAGCVIGAIGELGAAYWVQAALDDYNACVLNAISNADCATIAGWS